MAKTEPSPNGGNGRDERGRFAPGWKGGPGNPFGSQVAKLRSALLEAISEKDVRRIVRKLVAKAGKGDVIAAKLVLCYAVGTPDAIEETARQSEQEPIEIVYVDVDQMAEALDVLAAATIRRDEAIARTAREANGQSRFDGEAFDE